MLNKPSAMRILVIGGTGFIGGPVVRRLAAQGHQITVFHRGKTQGDVPEGIAHIQGERKNLSDFSDEFKRIAPQVVVDIIPYDEQDALTLLQTFRGIVQRVVAISSMDVYAIYDGLRGIDNSPPDPVPITEDSPLRKNLYPYRQHAKDANERGYSYDKIPIEQLVMGDTGILGTVLRLPFVYGPSDDKHRTFDYLKRMDDHRSAILLGEAQARWRSTRGYVENVADAIALAATDEKAAGRIYNVGELDALTEEQWVEHIGEAAGWDGKIIVIPDAELPSHLRTPFNWQYHYVVDTSRIREELNYDESVSRSEARRRTVEWERSNPPAEIDPVRFNYEAENSVLNAMKQGSGEAVGER